MAQETVHGSCHCKAVTFEAQVDFSKGTSRCNCTFCLKNRYWGVHVHPHEFKLLSGAEALQSYSRVRREKAFELNRKLEVYENDLAFCRICGTHAVAIGNIPEIGGDYVSLNVGCLDDVNFEKVMNSPLMFMNGKHDDWFSVPEYTKHL